MNEEELVVIMDRIYIAYGGERAYKSDAEAAKRFCSKNPEKIAEAFGNLEKFAPKLSMYAETVALKAAKLWAEVRPDMDFRKEAYEKFPQNYVSLLYKEESEAKEIIFRSVLNSDKFDLYQLKELLNLDSSAVKNMLTNDKDLHGRVEKMFSNPRDFYIVEVLKEDGKLDDVFDMNEKFEEVQKNLQDLSGKEVFEILRRNNMDIEGQSRAELLGKALSTLNEYIEQTSDLSARSEDERDLFYSDYRDKPSGEHLKLIGKFAEYPEIEQLMEEKIGKMYSFFSYPTPVYDEDSEERYHQVEYFSFVCKNGGNEFAKRMKEELVKDPTSLESAFYIKYAVDVLSQYDCSGRYSDTISEIIPQIIDKHPEVCDALVAGMKKDKRFFCLGSKAAENIKSELIKDPQSLSSQFYLAHIKDIFADKGPSGDDDRHFYPEISFKILEANKEKHPEICEKICDNLIDMYKDEKDKDTIQYHFGEFVASCVAYPSEKMKDFLNVCASRIELSDINLVYYTDQKKQSGLEIFDKLVDRILAASKGVVKLGNLQGGSDYSELFAKMEKAGVSKIEFDQDSMLEYKFDCSNLAKNTSLVHIEINDRHCDKLSFENPEVLLQLPKLRSLNINLNEEQAHKLYESLMKKKPQELHRLGSSIEFTSEEKVNLMTKYPDLIVRGSWSNMMTERNEKVVEALDKNTPLSKVAEKGILIEYLSVLPKEKRPHFEDLMKEDKESGKCPLDTLRKSASEYYGNLKKIAVILEDKKLDAYLDLKELAQKGKLVEHLENCKKEELPALDDFCYTNDALDNKTVFDFVEKEDRAKILQLMNVDEKDIKKLSKVECMGEAVLQWQAKKKLDQGNATAQAAFKAWQESRGIK